MTPRQTAVGILITLGIVAASLAVIGLSYGRAERHAAAGREFAARGLWSEAASEYGKAVRNFPLKGGYYLRRAECFESLGDADKAAALKKRARLLGAG